jgi:hypothetical protein
MAWVISLWLNANFVQLISMHTNLAWDKQSEGDELDDLENVKRKTQKISQILNLWLRNVLT